MPQTPSAAKPLPTSVGGKPVIVLPEGILAALHVLDMAGLSVLILGSDGTVRFLSAAAAVAIGHHEPAVCAALLSWVRSESAVQRRVGVPRGVVRAVRDGESTFRMSVGVLHAASEDDVIFAVVEVEYPQRNTVPRGQLERLTERERQVVRLIALGLSYKEIAEQLSIAVHTVRRHSERIFRKLGVHSRAKLMADFR